MPRAKQELSIGEARRIALAAQGFHRARPRRVTTQHLRAVIDRLGLLQIDSVSVVVPAHYQVVFSRVGPYDRQLLDDLVYRQREYTEQWGHEASILPVRTWPLLRHRMTTDERKMRALGIFMKQHAEYADRVLAEVRARGPLAASEVAEPDGSRASGSGWWGWTSAKAALEGHFAFGKLAIAGRRSAGFARLYDLAERVLPAEQHAHEPTAEEAQRALTRMAATSLGVATAGDIADYYRMRGADTRRCIAELVADGVLQTIRVEGWKDEAYMVAGVLVPRRLSAAALLSPFDPLVWYRPRAERLFAFDYRIEIYTPSAKRRYGYYVLPFLLGERIVGRVDLKTDRAGGTLRVLAAHHEPHCDPERVSPALATELAVMARWLGVDRVTVQRKGKLAPALKAAVRNGTDGRG